MMKPLNFIPSYIKFSDEALKEMNWMRAEALFSWKHTVETLSF